MEQGKVLRYKLSDFSSCLNMKYIPGPAVRRYDSSLVFISPEGDKLLLEVLNGAAPERTYFIKSYNGYCFTRHDGARSREWMNRER